MKNLLIYPVIFRLMKVLILDKDSAAVATFFISLGIWGFIIVRTCIGLDNANKIEKCKVQSVGDVIIAPFYAIGCNIGKKRFDVRLN